MYQCSVGFVWFWASRILPSTSKRTDKKNLDFYSFLWLLFTLLSLKTDVYVPTVSTVISKKIKNKLIMLPFWKPLKKRAGLRSVLRNYGSADPDPLQNVTDPEPWCVLCTVTARFPLQFWKDYYGSSFKIPYMFSLQVYSACYPEDVKGETLDLFLIPYNKYGSREHYRIWGKK